MDRWFAARYRAQSARWALLNLRHQDFEALWPTWSETVIRRNRRMVVERPVFHGHLFVKFDLSGWRWRAINSTQGIIRLLPMGSEEPVALPVGFVEALQSRNVAAPVITKVLETFAANSVVRILAGSFAGRTGRVVASGTKATRLKVEAFGGRETVLTLTTADLAAVTE
jgi:transcriptional antiterminator RfaH